MTLSFGSDIVGFTALSSIMEAPKVQDFLDRLYAKMDNLCEKHGLCKVETIGVSTAPAPRLFRRHVAVLRGPLSTPTHRRLQEIVSSPRQECRSRRSTTCCRSHASQLR